MSVDQQQTKRWPGSPDRAYPEVFTATPANQPKEKKPGQLTGQQLRQYVEDVSDESVLNVFLACITEITYFTQ